MASGDAGEPLNDASRFTRLGLDILQISDERAAADTISTAESVLASLDLDEPVYDRALLVLACAAYVHPERVPAQVVSKIIAVLGRAQVRAETCRIAKTVLQGLLAASLAKVVVDEIATLLRRPDISRSAANAMMEALEYAASWARASLHPQNMIPLVEFEHLQRYRGAFLVRILEPCLYAAGGSLTPSYLERVIHVYKDDPRLPYCLYYISQWKQFQPSVRETAASFVRGRFIWRDEVASRLSGQGRRLLVVHNIKDGQGDEMIRCVPLIGAFLDFNPSLEVTLIARRTYLYANPRVTVIPISDREQVQAALDQTFDGVIDFFEPDIRELNYDGALEDRVQDYVRQRRPFLFASSLKGFNRFLFERLELDSQPLAESLNLNEQRISNIYETTYRLIAELGLPLRCGEDPPGDGSLIAGMEWSDAEGEWRTLQQRNSGSRPVALLNPFGGGEKLKGVVEQNLDLMVAEIEALIEEGHFVILIPNGTAWGSAAKARELASRVKETSRALLEIAPDPAGAPDHAPPEMSYADYVMRQFTWFVRFADLIVTVEGWMMHVAWYLGKPYRVLMLTYSHSTEWHPYTRTTRQDVQTSYLRQDGTFREGDPPPLPEQPRRFTLMALLREFGNTGDVQALALVRKAIQSQDRGIRRAAAEALSKFSGASVDRDLVILLEDNDCGVRYRVARTLLDRSGTTSVPRDVLMAHVYIGQPDRDWPSVLKMGNNALPAVMIALNDDDPVVQREAERVQRVLNVKHAVSRMKQSATE